MKRVLLADDYTLMLDLMKDALERMGGLKVVGCITDQKAVLDMVRTQRPDVLIMSYELSYGEGYHYIRNIKRLAPDIHVLIFSKTQDPKAEKKAIADGASGFVKRTMDKEAFFQSIRGMCVHSKLNRSRVPRVISHNKVNEMVPLNRRCFVNDRQVELTSRELLMIKLLVEGNDTKKMAGELFLSEGRIRNIMTDILSKLMLNDKTQLVVYAFRNDLV